MLHIFDAHVHLFDGEANTYAFLEREDPTFRTIVGDYSALPRRYLPDDYLRPARRVGWRASSGTNSSPRIRSRKRGGASVWRMHRLSASPWSSW